MMLLYEARASACLVQEHQQHNWDSWDQDGPKKINLSHACPVGTGSLETWQKGRNRTPMMLMMLAKGASIISIIEGPFLHVWPPMRPMTPHLPVVSQPYPKRGLGASCQKGRAHDADLGGSGGRGRRQWRHPVRAKALDTGSALDHGGRAGF